MNSFINLKIFSPSEIFVEEQIKKLTVKDKNGLITILPRHIDFVTSFSTHILTYINIEDQKFFVAVNNGILTKVGRNINISVFNALTSDNLEDLKRQSKENLSNFSVVDNFVNNSVEK